MMLSPGESERNDFVLNLHSLDVTAKVIFRFVSQWVKSKQCYFIISTMNTHADVFDMAVIAILSTDDTLA